MKYEIKELKLHADERGWLAEMLKRTELKEDIKQVYVATINPGHIRGNHYHLKRKEWFFLVGGKAKIYLQNVKTKEKTCLNISPGKPNVITIFPGIAHAVKNTGKEMIYLVSAQSDVYDPKNTDTFFHQVIV